MSLQARSVWLILGWLILGHLTLPAQMAGPSPLASPLATARLAPGGWMEAEARADRALQSGFCATAAELYRELLRDPGLPAESRPRLALARVTALLDGGELAEADAELRAYDGPHNTTYQLRAGLIAVTGRRLGAAKAALAAGHAEELSNADRGWWFFLQAAVADAENDFARANNLYEQALGAAVSDLQRARFALGEEQALLRRGQLDEARLANLRRTMDTFQGRTTGFDAARSYAAALAALGRAPEAQAVLERQLAIIPPGERNVADQFRLMLGLIAGDGSVAGRRAFLQLLRNGQKPDTQRLALLLLARGAKTTAERDELRRDLTELISAPVQHPIIEDLLLTRAQSSLIDKDYPRADEDARALLERYPGTPLRPAALGVRLAVAWDSKRYRAAADAITQLRAVLPASRERSELAVLLAEAFFRAAELSANSADDYRSAADAYDAALHEAPIVVPAGTLIFQRVLADIRAGTDRLAAAAKQLDDAAGNPAFDPVSRWQAEWNLVKAMQVRGLAQDAYARVDRLLGGPATGVPSELRIRLMWLRAKLSFDNQQHEQALKQVDELLTELQSGATIDAGLRTEITAMSQLLKAQALLGLKRDKEGIALLDKLRTDFRATPAAQYSYLVQATHLAQRGDLAGAQGVLQSFIDNPDYQNSEYAPVALYEIALNLERQGLDRNLEEANKKLERLIHDYPKDDLVFYARLKQGDLMRKLNEFARARVVYEFLVNNYAGHPDELLAQLALADTFFAQGANSVANYESASTIYERLRDLPAAPIDLRAEAGFKWGYALAKRAAAVTAPAEHAQGMAKAQSVYWSVVDSFLLHPTQAELLGAKGRYWVARCLLELGQNDEEAGRYDEAQRAYALIVEQKLGGAAQAQAKLARFRANAAGGTKP